MKSSLSGLTSAVGNKNDPIRTVSQLVPQPNWTIHLKNISRLLERADRIIGYKTYPDIIKTPKYRVRVFSIDCSDIDECSNDKHICGPHATCENTKSSFTCEQHRLRTWKIRDQRFLKNFLPEFVVYLWPNSFWAFMIFFYFILFLSGRIAC